MTTLAAMRQQGLDYEKTYTIAWLTEQLGMAYPSLAWGYAVTSMVLCAAVYC